MRAVYYLSIILPVLALAVSGWRGDWTWSILSVIAFIVILLPAILTKDFNQTYHKKVAVLFPIPFIAYIVLSLLNMAVSIGHFDVYSYAIQTFAAMACGMLLMIAIGASSREVKISKRWILLFSIAFACMFAIVCTFIIYAQMSADGWLVTNDDFAGGVDNTDSNRHLMLPCFLTTFLSLIYGYILRCIFKRIPKTEISLYYGAD